MRQIPPLRLKQKYWRYIDDEIKRIFDMMLFCPMAAILKTTSDKLENTVGDALYDAIAQGTVWYADGRFFGDFNAKITRIMRTLGASYNQKTSTWALQKSQLPTELSIAQARADERYTALRRAFIRTLDDAHVASVDKISDSRERYEQTIDWMNEDFEKSVASITIAPKLTKAQNKFIASEWGTNLDLYIKKWVSEDIVKLRQDVQANAFAGRRANDLVQMMRDNYGVSRRKAEFLARQETSLLLSKFREVRARDVGSQRYRWSTSHDERVRHDHKDLNGKIFDWTQPPVTNRKTGARNHPGEDFGCRCIAIALID